MVDASAKPPDANRSRSCHYRAEVLVARKSLEPEGSGSIDRVCGDNRNPFDEPFPEGGLIREITSSGYQDFHDVDELPAIEPTEIVPKTLNSATSIAIGNLGYVGYIFLYSRHLGC